MKKAVAANEKRTRIFAATFTGKWRAGTSSFPISGSERENHVIIPPDVCRDGRCRNRTSRLPEQVSYVIIRAISDKEADNSATMDGYPTFESNCPQCKVYERIASDDPKITG